MANSQLPTPNSQLPTPNFQLPTSNFQSIQVRGGDGGYGTRSDSPRRYGDTETIMWVYRGWFSAYINSELPTPNSQSIQSQAASFPLTSYARRGRRIRDKIGFTAEVRRYGDDNVGYRGCSRLTSTPNFQLPTPKAFRARQRASHSLPAHGGDGGYGTRSDSPRRYEDTDTSSVVRAALRPGGGPPPDDLRDPPYLRISAVTVVVPRPRGLRRLRQRPQ